MAISHPKSATRIEIWRGEVALSTSTTSFSASETTYIAPPIRQPIFWKKILRRASTSAPGSYAKSRSKRSKSEGRDSVKTEMYEQHGEEGGLRLPEEGKEGSSMEIGSFGESGVGGLRERMERLERAARLLNGGGSGVVGVKRDEESKQVSSP